MTNLSFVPSFKLGTMLLAEHMMLYYNTVFTSQEKKKSQTGIDHHYPISTVQHLGPANGTPVFHRSIFGNHWNNKIKEMHLISYHIASIKYTHGQESTSIFHKVHHYYI
jgi:hypothetical protein